MIAGYADKRVGHNMYFVGKGGVRGERRGILVTYDLTVRPAP